MFKELFSNHYFRLYTRCYRSGNCGSLEEYHRVGAGSCTVLVMVTMPKQPSSRGLAEIMPMLSRASPLTYSGFTSRWLDRYRNFTSSQLASWGALYRRKLEDIEANMGMIIEGISTTKVAHELASRIGCSVADYTSHLPSHLWRKRSAKPSTTWWAMDWRRNEWK